MVKHGGDIYSGGELLGAALETIADSVRVFHVAWQGENYWTKIIRRSDKRGDDHCQSIGICLRSVWGVIRVRSL